MKKKFSIYERKRKDESKYIQWRYKGRFILPPFEQTKEVRKKDWIKYQRTKPEITAKTRKILAAQEKGIILFGKKNPHTKKYDRGTWVKRKADYSNKSFDKREDEKRHTKITDLIRKKIKADIKEQPSLTNKYFKSRIRWLISLFRWPLSENGNIIVDSPDTIELNGALAIEGDYSFNEIIKISSEQRNINNNVIICVNKAKVRLKIKEHGFTPWTVEESEGTYVNYFKNLTLKGNRASGYNRPRKNFNPLNL